jgi:hypothetical protein
VRHALYLSYVRFSVALAHILPRSVLFLGSSYFYATTFLTNKVLVFGFSATFVLQHFLQGGVKEVEFSLLHK